MRSKMLSLTFVVIILFLFSCQKELTFPEMVVAKDIQPDKTDSLPSSYPFATGYCTSGSSLGVSIIDTSYYRSYSTDSLPGALILDMPSPGNQGSQQSCVAWATVYAVGGYYAHANTGKPYSDTTSLSPKYAYNQIAKGNCGCTSFLDNLYILQTQGACPLPDMPYSENECALQPDSLQRQNAATYRIKGWKMVDMHDLTLIKRAIFEKMPVLFAIATDDGFKNLKTPYVWKQRSGAVAELHAMVIVGFDDSKSAFRVMNSWSTAWADKGFAWIDYNFFVSAVIDKGYVVL